MSLVYKTGSQKPRQRRVRWVTILCLGILLCGLTLRTNATVAIYSYGPRCSLINMKDTTIYLYENGVPVADPNAYIQGGGVYSEGDLLGTIDPSNNNIINSQNQVIGYVVSGS